MPVNMRSANEWDFFALIDITAAPHDHQACMGVGAEIGGQRSEVGCFF